MPDDKTATVDFRPPPPSKPGIVGKVDWPAVIAALKERQGDYGFVGTFSSGLASHIRTGRYAVFLPGEASGWLDEEKRRWMADHWSVETRAVGKNATGGYLFDVFVKWLG